MRCAGIDLAGVAVSAPVLSDQDVDRDKPEDRGAGVVRIHAGETVLCPPDEEHWHGAASDTFMSHLALLENLPGGGDPTTWLEPAPGEQYRAADQR